MLFYTMKNTDMLQLYAIEFHANVFRVIFLHKCSSRFVLVVHFAPLPLYTYKQLYMCISRYPFCSGGPFRPTLPNTHINMYKSICVHCIRSLGSTEDNWTKKVKYGDVQWSSHERAGSRPLSALPFSLGPFHASSLKAMPIMSIDSRPVAFVSSLRGKLAPPPPTLPTAEPGFFGPSYPLSRPRIPSVVLFCQRWIDLGRLGGRPRVHALSTVHTCRRRRVSSVDFSTNKSLTNIRESF